MGNAPLGLAIRDSMYAMGGSRNTTASRLHYWGKHSLTYIGEPFSWQHFATPRFMLVRPYRFTQPRSGMRPEPFGIGAAVRRRLMSRASHGRYSSRPR